MKVYVLTNLESGWDCVSGVYKDYKDALRYIGDCEGLVDPTDEELEDLYDTGDTQFVIHDKVVM